jgi:hypothetical protein
MSERELYEVEYSTMGNPGSPIYFYGSFTEEEIDTVHRDLLKKEDVLDVNIDYVFKESDEE